MKPQIAAFLALMLPVAAFAQPTDDEIRAAHLTCTDHLSFSSPYVVDRVASRTFKGPNGPLTAQGYGTWHRDWRGYEAGFEGCAAIDNAFANLAPAPVTPSPDQDFVKSVGEKLQ